MLIDWFTVGAQIVNFLVLVWLLKRYLYRPILNAIDAREKAIVNRQNLADAKEKQAQKDQEECRHQKETLEQQRLALTNTARDEAKAERTRLLEEATRELESLRLARRKELEEETANYRGELIRITRQEIIATVRKILSDLASATLENSAVDVFLHRLEELPSKKADKTTFIANGLPPVRMRSTFPVTPAQQESVKKDVQDKFQTIEPVEFEVVPDLGLGLELIVHDQKIAWNIDSYLSSFETRLTEFAEKKS